MTLVVGICNEVLTNSPPLQMTTTIINEINTVSVISEREIFCNGRVCIFVLFFSFFFFFIKSMFTRSFERGWTALENFQKLSMGSWAQEFSAIRCWTSFGIYESGNLCFLTATMRSHWNVFELCWCRETGMFASELWGSGFESGCGVVKTMDFSFSEDSKAAAATRDARRPVLKLAQQRWEIVIF